MTSKHRFLLAIAILATVVWAVYGVALRNPFEFDDWHVIVQNPEVRTPADVPGFFVDVSKFSILPGNRDYRPLFLTSMALSWWVGDGATLPFHLVSVGFHMGNVVLLFLIARRLLSRTVDPVGGLAEAETEGGAFLAALLFAVHPLATEAVVYISSQSVPMAAFFYLLAFYLFLTTYSGSARSGGATTWLLKGASYLAYFCALLSKPIAITLPIVLAIWEATLNRSVPVETQPWWRRTWRRLAKHLPYVAVTLVYLWIRSAVVGNPIEQLGGRGRPLAEVLTHHLTQTKALVFYYLRLALLPVGQSVDREYPTSHSLFEADVLLAVGILMLLGWLLIRFRRYRALVFFSLWFPSCLLVTTYLVALGQTVREARVYLSLMGLCAVAGLLLVWLWRALPDRPQGRVISQRVGRVLVAGAIGLLVGAFAYGAVNRNRIWSSDLTLWEDAARKQGTWRAHMNYALALEDVGRSEEALREFEVAVERGSYAWSHLNLGLARIRRGEHDRGLWHLRTAVSLWPSSPETHYYLARGLDSSGNPAEAEKELKRALELRPDYLLAYRSLGELYERSGRAGLALTAYERLLELDPGEPEVEALARSLRQKTAGDPAARADFLFSRAFTHQQQGDRSKSIELYEELLRGFPDHKQGTFNLAYAYLNGDSSQEWRQSIELFERALEVDPDYSECIFHLATAHWKLGEAELAGEHDRTYLEKGRHEDLRRRSSERLRNGS